MTRRDPGSGTAQDLGGGKWRLRVYLGRDPVSGRQRRASKIITVKGRDVKRQVRDQLAQMVEEHRGKIVGSTSSMETVLGEFLRFQETQGLSPRTLNEGRRAADTVLIPLFGPIPVSELTTRTIDQGWAKLTAQGQSATSVRRYHAVLSAALSEAVRWEWIPSNPAHRAKPPKIRAQPPVAPSPAEVRSLLAAAEVAPRSGPRYATALALLALTGMRRGEVCALKWEDVRLEVPEVRVRHSFVRVKGEMILKEPKSGRERWVRLDDRAAELLGRWRAAGGEGYVVGAGPHCEDPMNPDTLTTFVYRLTRELGMPHVHVHSLRHFAATQMTSDGVPVRDAAEVLGHADGGRLLLSTYAHATPDGQRRAAESLGRILEPGGSG